MILEDPQSWALETFGTCDLGDYRRTRRLVTMASALARHGGSGLVEACGGTDAELEGAYRFVENQHIESEAIREGGFETAARRVGEYDVLLACEDTTTLSYDHAPKGTGSLGGPKGTRSRGLWVHSSLLVDPKDGLTVGLIDQHWWVRPPDEAKEGGEQESGEQESGEQESGEEKVEGQEGASKTSKPYEERESFKWQHCAEAMRARLGPHMSRVISVCDREADVFEYLSDKLAHGERFVVRSSVDRRLEDAEVLLGEEADSWWPSHHREVTVPQKGGRKRRVARLEVSAAEVVLKVPSSRKAGVFEPLTVNVVQVWEPSAPEGEEPLFWRLFTTEPIDTPEQLDFIVTAYELRWRVEDFHKSWKTGCKVEKLRMRTVDNIARAASILAFIAVRLLRLREFSEHDSDQPCTTIFSEEEWRCLWASVEKTAPPATAPTLGWAHIAIARLAGWYGSKKKGRVGWLKYWKGYRRFQDLYQGWMLARRLPRGEM